MTVGKRKEVTVEDVADVTFVSLDENALVADAAKTMYERKADTIIVTRNDPRLGVRIPVGIVTQRDLIYRVIAQNKGPYKVTIGSIMSTPVSVIKKSASSKEALQTMKDHGFGRLPVVTKTGEIVGLVTMEMVLHKLPLKRIAS